MTSYVVLKKEKLGKNIFEGVPDAPADVPAVRDATCWVPVGPPVESVSAEAAIRKAVDGDKGGTFVAPPLRSFQEMTVTVETKRTVKVA